MNSAQHRIIAAGVIGNVLEWYDFAIYGYFAAAIGRQFFPHEDPVAQVLSAFGVFALGYLMRPIGGALFGHIGDQFGRRAALTLSVAAMAIPTFLIGLLPGYATLGTPIVGRTGCFERCAMSPVGFLLQSEASPTQQSV
jgi:MHS family proline/betaine transporter-like MFS transporter